MFVNSSRWVVIMLGFGLAACESPASTNAVPPAASPEALQVRPAPTEEESAAPAAVGGAQELQQAPAEAAQAPAIPNSADVVAAPVVVEPDAEHPRAERGGKLTEAYAGLARGEQQRIDELIAEIDAQKQADPDDKYAVFYAGVFRLWRLAEGEATLEGLLGSLTNMEDALTNLERGHELLPNDFRVTAFFGMAQALIGGLLGDDKLLDAGIVTLDHAIEQEPSYGSFLRAMAIVTLPTDHKYFHYVMEDMALAAQSCNYPSGRDGATFEYPNDDQLRSRVCLNKSFVPHVWEGIFMSYGDMALKAGWDAERVRGLYRSAKSSPDYQDWFYRDMLEQRIDDADKNVAAFADDDPFNDPPVWALAGQVCTGCHKDVASLRMK